MAGRRSQGEALADRVQRAGWPVERVIDGWRVTCPDGNVRVIHLTPSDTNAYKVALREFNRLGLAAAEVAAAEREEAERKAAIASDREANDRRLESARATALARAAGPYGPAQVTINEILAEHPAPIIFGRVLITPAMATAMLERNKPTVKAPWPMRPIRAADVTVWAKRLRTGRLAYTHQGVAFDEDGRLQDGQHRLTAIVETGVTGEILVSAGWPRGNYHVLDTGRRRTASQVLQHEGASYSASTAAAVRLIYVYGVWGKDTLTHAGERVDNDVIAEVWSKLDADVLDWATKHAQRLRQQLGRLGPAGCVAALYVVRNKVGEHPQVEFFADGLVRGVEPDDEDPIYALRRQLTHQASRVGRKLTAAEQMALVVKAWNAYIQGRRVKHLVVGASTAMPPITAVPRQEETRAS